MCCGNVGGFKSHERRAASETARDSTSQRRARLAARERYEMGEESV